jgi:hypothetical protein
MITIERRRSSPQGTVPLGSHQRRAGEREWGGKLFMGSGS